MVPSKVIHIREARRRVARAKKAKRAPRQSPIGQRISAWLTSSTTKANVLVAGLVASLVTGAIVASIITTPAPQAVDGLPTAETSYIE